MKHIDLAISGMSCGHCVNSVRTALGSVPALEVIGVTIGHFPMNRFYYYSRLK